MITEGKISISRSLSCNSVNIDVVDEDGRLIVRMKMTPADFGNAIVGRAEQKTRIIKRFNKKYAKH